MDIAALQRRLAQFADERDWEQFSSPKNLAMALAGEAAEILEIFQWLTEEQSRRLAEQPEQWQAARLEVADVFLYLVRLADKLGIDIEQAVNDKIAINTQKYPVELARGNAVKYNQRGDGGVNGLKRDK